MAIDTRTQSWAEVEETIQMDLAIWKSSAAAPQLEFRDLVEGASVKFMESGVATISIGKLEWRLNPTDSVSMRFCDSNHEDWFRGQDSSGSNFRVSLRAPRGRGELQVFPCSDDHGSLSVDDDKLNNILTHFFSPEETGFTSTSGLMFRRTKSQKKRGEIVAKTLGPPFVRCVKDLHTATCVSDVLDTVLEFSAAYVANQVADEAADIEDGYFYDKEVMEEERPTSRRNGALWVRQQVRDAATKCQVAAEATSEVAKLGAGMLVKPKFRGKHVGNDLLVDDRSEYSLIELNPGNSNFGIRSRNEKCPQSGGANSPSLLEKYLNESGERDHKSPDASNNYPLNAFLRTPSFRESDIMGNGATVSESVASWDESEQANDEVDDVLGAGVSDAETLDMMLRDCDPCGSSDCSNLINQYLSLNLRSTNQEHFNVEGLETPRSNVLKRLASWSSSNPGWSDRDIPASASKRIQKMQTVVEEPACDSEVARLCYTFVRKAAAKGDVLQWCSCKFNKARSSVELRFQVGCFMEDDIATLSTGINRHCPLHIEIFLDPFNMRQSLLSGDVRVSVDQSPGGFESNTTTPPVVGLSCYMPHLVRHYLKYHYLQYPQDHFPDGELITGLMKHVVVKLVFITSSCCVCGREAGHPDHDKYMITCIVPRPCEQNLCQALHEAWLVVAPQMVLEQFTVELWLRTWFKEGEYSDERQRMLQFMDELHHVSCSHYDSTLSSVINWLGRVVVQRRSWLRMVSYLDTTMEPSDEELDFRARLLANARKLSN